MSKESWVPDHLPDFSNKDMLSVALSMATTTKLSDLALKSNLKPIEFTRILIKFGLGVAKTEDINTVYKIISQDNNDLTEEDISLPLEGKSFTLSIGGNSQHLKIPDRLGNEIRAIANKHHTTIEHVLESIVQVGLSAAISSQEGSKTIIVRYKDGREREILFFGNEEKDE